MLNIFDHMQEPPDGARIVVEDRPGWAQVYLRDDVASEIAMAPYLERWRACDGRISRIRWFTFEEATDGGVAVWVLGEPVAGSAGG